MLLPLGNPFICHEEVFISLQPMISPKRFDIFSSCLTEGCSEGPDAFRYFLKESESRCTIYLDQEFRTTVQ